MKTTKNIFLMLGIVLVVSISSCEKWITVNPRTQIENTVFFSDRQGFVEGLNGIYVKMIGTSLYGREMTFGMVDVLGRIYSIGATSITGGTRDLYDGNYTNSGAYGTISTVWGEMYNAIANLNNLIEQLETADRRMFLDGEYDRIKGEALGLRAFMHFDLIRLFTPSYREGGESAEGIPYVTVYAPTITPRLTVKDAMEKVMTDLKAAEALLSADIDLSGFESRRERFNYYAVKGTMARVYLWKQDIPNGLKEAEDVIAVRADKFPFVTVSSVSATGASRNRVFTTEHLFGVTSPRLQDNYANLLDTARIPTLSITAAFKNEVYESSNTDLRHQYLIKDVSADPNTPGELRGIWYSKLHQPSTSNRMPLIKIPEMYYIAAECLLGTDPGKALEYLNTVRTARGLGNLGSSLTATEIEAEIRKEYRKEMPCEGQLFYYFKRTNATTVPAHAGTYPASRYLLPLPQRELDFGN